MRRLVLSALAAVLLASVARADDLSEAAPVIDAANADWIPALKARDAGRIAGAYAIDGLAVDSYMNGAMAWSTQLGGTASSAPLRAAI